MAVNQVATLGVKVDPRGAVTGASRAKRAITGIGDSARNVKNRIMSMQGALLGLGAGAVLKSIITTASSVESLQIRLKFLTGSIEDASKAFEIMNSFAKRVPFSLEDIELATPSLLTVAKDVNELNQLLEITGDIAAVSGLSFTDTARQLQRAFASGIASAEMFTDGGISLMLGFEAGVSKTGKETKKIILDMFEGGTANMKGATDDLKNSFVGGVSMMQDAFRDLKLVVADSGVFKMTANVVKGLTDLLRDPKTVENAQKLGEVIVGIGNAIGTVGGILLGLPPWVLEFGIVIAFLGGKKAKAAIVILTSITLGFEAIQKAIKDFQNITPEDKLNDQLEGLEARLDNVSAKLTRARLEYAEFVKIHGEDMSTMNSNEVNQFDFLTKEIEKYANELPKTKARIQETHHALEIQKESVKDLKDEYKALMGLHMEEHVFGTEQILSLEFYNEQLDLMMKGYKDVGIEATKLATNIDVVNKHMDKNSMLALNMALNLQKIQDEAELAKEKTREFAQSMSDNIEDSIMKMTQGLMSFKDVVKSVFQYVAMEMVRANIAKPLAGALSGILTGSTDHGGKGDGGFLGKVFSGLDFATGGRPPVGQASLVGERGAEMFVPDRAGTIVPNNQMGGQTINVTYSPQINALDPRTAQSVIAENAPTIVGVIRQAFNQNGQEVAI